MTIKYEIDKEMLDELTGVIEDSVQYICDQNMLSGELVWTILETLASSKLAQLHGHID